MNTGVCGPDGTLATGKPFCDIIKGRMKGLLYADQGVTFSEADMASQATFLAAVALKSRAPRGSRVYPLWDLNDFDDNTPEPATGSLGNLTTKTIYTTDPVPAFSFGYPGGELLLKKLLQLEVGQYDLFLVDSNFVVYGKGLTSGELGGYTVYQNYVFPSKFIGQDAVKQYRFTVTLNSYQEYRADASFFVANSGIGAINGINNVVLEVVDHTTNVVKVSFIADGGKDMTNLFPTAMATAANILVTKDSDGTPFTVTSRVVVAGTPGYVLITLDSTAYTAAPSLTKINFNMAAPSVLKTNGIDGFESTGQVQITKP